MTDVRARIGEAISTETTSSRVVSREEAAGREGHWERGGGTGSG